MEGRTMTNAASEQNPYGTVRAPQYYRTDV